MHKVITFLGVSPKPTTYTYDGREYSGSVFAEVLCQLLDDFDEMLVFVTPEARTKSWPTLEALGDERLIPIDIPNGETSAEMWQTFDAVTGAVHEGDSVTFDITHGLRSIPFLVFLAAAFLKSAKDVSIRGIYYGAMVLDRSASGEARPAPIIDLTGFVSLLDWLIASDRMIRLGDASQLAARLRESGPTAEQAGIDRDAGIQRSNLNRAANALEAVSRSLRLILPDQTMEASEKLLGTLGAATATMEQWARPYGVLAERVIKTYASLALPNPRHHDNTFASLNRERQMVQWYLDRGLSVQAVALAREWLVSWIMIQAKLIDLYNRDMREEAEKALSGANRQRIERSGAFDDLTFSSGKTLKAISQHVMALTLYDQLGNVRNTLLHAGKRSSRPPADTLEKQIIELCQQLNDLPLLDDSEDDA